MVDQGELERRFNAAMLEIYERAGAELGYWATRYLQLLRRRGGLEAARYLLRQKATSDGYQALREVGRLDLTVESLVLTPEFAALFTSAELSTAHERRDYFGGLAERQQREITADPVLRSLLADASDTPAMNRVQLYRDKVVCHGADAILPLERWVAAGGSMGFAIACLEAIGRSGDDRAATRALARLSAQHRDWATVADAAIDRLNRR